MSNKAAGEKILEEVQATLAVLLDTYLDIDNPMDIDWEANTREFCETHLKSDDEQIIEFTDENQKPLESFGKVMIDMHLMYGVEIEYEAYTEFDTFETLEDVYNYIVDKVLISKGFDPATLEPAR